MRSTPEPTLLDTILLDLITNIRLNWKCLPGINTLAYFASLPVVQGHNLDTWGQCYKTFLSVIFVPSWRLLEYTRKACQGQTL